MVSNSNNSSPAERQSNRSNQVISTPIAISLLVRTIEEPNLVNWEVGESSSKIENIMDGDCTIYPPVD